MKFTLFRKHKEEIEQQKPAQATEQPKEETIVNSEEPKEESAKTEEIKTEAQPTPQPLPEAALSPSENQVPPAPTPVEEPKQETLVEPASKTYLKAMPLKELSDVENVKNEVEKGNIIILKVTPLANKSIEDVKTAVNQLFEYAESTGGDIARLGEERVVICPKNIRIWREKSPSPTESLPTAAPTAA